ncbi:MAG: NADH-quinone oxidoreductase subunit L [Planctomycetia bacterium]|nr:NADH-quinone oxidoreductase subunit L [Planctomycetia bacterium]
MAPDASLPLLLGLAWLLPLASFALIVLVGPKMGKAGVLAAYVATGAILTSFVLSVIAFGIWHFGHLGYDRKTAETHVVAAAEDAHGSGEHAAGESEHAGADSHAAHGVPTAPPRVFTKDWYTLAQFGALKLSISYYIDSLTVLMFTMVSLIATLIHFYSFGYMHEELHEVVDHEVTLADGHHLHRRGRFYRFFQYLSLFCFSMLGLVIAGNVLMVFVFWELVGICSYFLIGFYIERKSAQNAANKAFIVNRVGDFGMIIGMMALWASLGTFAFGDIDGQQGIFSSVRPSANESQVTVPDGMVKFAATEHVAAGVEATPAQISTWRSEGYGYWLLVIAGVGIFCGCVGKSAQFPLHVWLPDAMEGPTPVSALVHSATMVAAGVYLAGRFYPVFAPEALLVIAYVGAITLLLAATIAITAVDIKRVLAYSTVSQLGYMMLALGVGGWAAGLFHLVTHAFFKSLLFMCSGSVIHAVHTNDMRRMGGLRHKMPWTAYTMLVGVLAIYGAAIPFVVGLSGYYSKDSIIAQALSFWNSNPTHGAFFAAAAIGGAGITAFYMFRLWFMTFAGEPRDHHAYEHAHESPKVMYVPLVILAFFAVTVGFPRLPFSVPKLLEQARYPGEFTAGKLLPDLVYPEEHLSHLPQFHNQAEVVVTFVALGGLVLAIAFYGLRILNPAEVKSQFSAVYRLLWNKWYFDELYDAIFVRPVLLISKLVGNFDRRFIDGFVDGLARWTRAVANFDDVIDRYLVDGSVNVVAAWTYSIADGLRGLQTGKLRQYVMLIVIGTVALTLLIRWSVAAG